MRALYKYEKRARDFIYLFFTRLIIIYASGYLNNANILRLLSRSKHFFFFYMRVLSYHRKYAH